MGEKKKSSSVKSDGGDNGKDNKYYSKGKKTIGMHNESAGNLYEGVDELSNCSGHNSDHKVFAMNNDGEEKGIKAIPGFEGMDTRGPLSDIGDNSTTYTTETHAKTNQKSLDPNVKLT